MEGDWEKLLEASVAGGLQGDVQAGLVQSLSHVRLGLEESPSPVTAPFCCQTLTLCAPSSPLAMILLLPPPCAFRDVGTFLCFQSHAGSAQPAESQPVPCVQSSAYAQTPKEARNEGMSFVDENMALLCLDLHPARCDPPLW